MNYRTATILAEESLSGAGTKTIDILIKDVISRIWLTWRTTLSKHGMDSYQHSDVTKIELVDGSDVLHGLNGGQNQALCIFDRKAPTMNYGQHMSGNSQLASFGIDFGRFLYDTELALDPRRFTNLVLKVSYDVDVADTGVTTGNLEVKAEVFDEKQVSPFGFLSAKEHHSRTPPASGYWYVDLPTDRALRKLLVQGYQAAYEPWYQVSEARIDEDNEKRIPFDWNLESYYRAMMGSWKPIEEVIIATASAGGKNFYVTPTDYWAIITALNHNNATDLNIGAASMRGGKCLMKSAAASQFGGIARGYLPNHCFEFPFGMPGEVNDWYDVTKLGSLRLRMKAGSAGAAGTVAVVLQQLRRY